MGGHKIPQRGPTDDGYDPRGYDETQRAEILEETRGGKHEGGIVTDLDSDVRDSLEDEQSEDSIQRDADGRTQWTVDGKQSRQDRAEDEAQADWDAGRTGDAGRTPGERDAMEP